MMPLRCLVALLATLSACRLGPAPAPPTPDSEPAAASGPGDDLAPVDALPSYIKLPDRQYVLRDTVHYRLHGPNLTVTIPAGFVTDFASIPKKLRFLFTHDDIHDLPGLLHDYMYWRQCNRSSADRMFLLALDEVGVGFFERHLLYAGVDLGALKAWKDNRQARNENLPRIVPPEFMKIPPGFTWSRYRAKLREAGVQLDALDVSLQTYCNN